MKPTRKGEQVTNNAWGAAKAPGTARSNTPVPTIAKTTRTSAAGSGKSDYKRKPVGMSDANPPKTHTPQSQDKKVK